MAQAALRIAIVDDDAEFLRRMLGYLDKAALAAKLPVRISTFVDAIDFVSDYRGDFDAIFLDVEMPEMDGFETARRIRQMDQTVCILFVTNMAQYAIRGYEVNALDYVVKPVAYATIAEKLRKAADFCSVRRDGNVILADGDELVRVRYSQIRYIEKERNYLMFHTAQGDFRRRGALFEIEEDYLACGFGRCTSGCLINYAYVAKTGKDTVWLEDGAALPVSRAQRREFIDGLMRYLGGGR